MHTIDLLDEQKNRKRDDQKIENVVQKNPIVERCRSSRFGGRDTGIILTGKIDKQV